MEERSGYEVLKLVMNGERCYVSTDYVRGRPLIQWLKYHSRIPKEQMYQWLLEIIRQLEYFHKCRGNPCYQYMNPYSIIVTEDERLLLLDIGSGNQQDILHQMQRRKIRESFLSPGNQYYQKNTEQEDIYSLGKTIQYILAATETEPPFTRREEIKFQRIISKCLNQKAGKQYQTIREVSEHFPKRKEKGKYQKKNRRTGFFAGVAGLFLISAVGVVLWSHGSKAEKELKASYSENSPSEKADSNKQNLKEADTGTEMEDKSQEEKELVYDMGLLYFLEMEDYGKSRETFGRLVDDRLAENFVKLSDILLRQQDSIRSGELEMLLTEMEEQIPDRKDERYYLSLLKGYALLDTEAAWEEKVRLCEYCLNMEEWKVQDRNHEKEKKVKGILAASCEKTGNMNGAKQQYMELLEMEEGEERKNLYQKLATLLKEMKETDKAVEVCQKGMTEYPDSMGIKNTLIWIQCSDASVDRQICADTVKRLLADCPELEETEEFQKMKQEYEIRVEGEEVWVGK